MKLLTNQPTQVKAEPPGLRKERDVKATSQLMSSDKRAFRNTFTLLVLSKAGSKVKLKNRVKSPLMLTSGSRQETENRPEAISACFTDSQEKGREPK